MSTNHGVTPMMELPASVKAGTETRKKYAKFAQEFYNALETHGEIYIERIDDTDSCVGYYHGKPNDERDAHQLLSYARDASMYIKFRSLPVIKSAKDVVIPFILGILIPQNINHSPRVYNSRGTGKPGLLSQSYRPVESILEVARNVVPTIAMKGYTYYAITFPYIHSMMYLLVTYNSRYPYYIVYARNLPERFHTYPESVFYNCVHHRVEDRYGIQIRNPFFIHRI